MLLYQILAFNIYIYIYIYVWKNIKKSDKNNKLKYQLRH